MLNLLLIICFISYNLVEASPSGASIRPLSEQKEQVIQLFKQKKYAKVCKQLEVVMPLLTRKLDRLEMQFLQAYCKFYIKQYEESSNLFHNFVEQNPAALKREEAVFMRGYSLSFKEMDVHLDQTVTHTAIDYLEAYVADYPSGCYLDKAMQALQTLQERLMKKSLHVAHIYFRLGLYRAAMVVLENFKRTYPASFLAEAVDRLWLESKQKLAKTA
ncbi:MAG: outer membrane protein assembly factor BamD [Candidatus Cardinium sp.]|nr:outer membrane protein assembly factor BamD [Candidatus Cardinium sp.]